jgi:hypothetical protein
MISTATRVVWTLLPTFLDPGPLTFQLQTGTTSNPNADDWEDVGLPVVDQYFAFDDEQRVWGKTEWTHYRVVLTTALGVYYSDPTGGLGILDRRSWRIAREKARTQLKAFKVGNVGQQGYLLKRRWTGIPCPVCTDYMTRASRNPDCPTCFDGETLIRAESGYKPIREIAVGERVLTVDGSYQLVTETMQRPYRGPAYLIRTSTMTRPMLVTPEHPIRALTSSHVFRDAEQVRTYGFAACGPCCDGYMRRILGAFNRPSGVTFHRPTERWRSKVQSGGLRGGEEISRYHRTQEEARRVVRAHREKHLDLGHYLDWVEARDLHERYWIDTTYPHGEQDIASISAPVLPAAGRSKVYASRRGETKFAVDEEFLWMVGMYIAEGCARNREITFALHQAETAYSERLVRFFSRYGYNSTVKPETDDLGMTVNIGSTTLAEWFPRWLGTYCYNKRIPEELMHLPAGKTWALIRGIWDGDGTKDTNEIGQTSEVLSLQLIELLHRLGEQPTVHRMTPRPDRRPAWMTSWAQPTLTNANRHGRWNFAGLISNYPARRSAI